MRERVGVKSPVRENRSPGSVRGAPGNRRPYRNPQAAYPAGRRALTSLGVSVQPSICWQVRRYTALPGAG